MLWCGMGRGREGGGRYRHDIQGLRAVAVLIVVVFHTGVGLSGGFVGVDAFLVISGFVIAALLRRELASTGTISLRGFYARRIRRLLPSLSVMLVAVVLAAMLLESPLGRQQSTVRTAIAASFSGANLWLFARGTGYFTPDESANPLLHTWSLSIEEQFYLLLPALLLVLWRIDRRRSAGTPGFVPAAGLALLGAASFALSCAFAYHLGPAMQVTDPERFGFYLLPTRV